MGVEASKVVLGGVQLSSLDQLQGQQLGEPEPDLHLQPEYASLQCDLGQVILPL